jgi:hypothetical protein
MHLVPASKEDEAYDVSVPCRYSEQFRPAGGASPPWRRLEVVVTPEGIRASFEGQSLGMVTAAELLAKTHETQARLAKQPLVAPYGTDWTPEFSPRGPIGLYMERGAASFRRVVVEPLSEKD